MGEFIKYYDTEEHVFRLWWNRLQALAALRDAEKIHNIYQRHLWK